MTAALPGASPETMAAAVATPLENQFSTIAGLNSMSSSNSLGNTQITLEFDLGRKLDGAAVDVQAAITQASRLLPQGMPTPPTFTKVNPADQPILYIALTSPTLPLWTLDEYAETRIAQRISMISGVAQVQVLGAQKYAVHVQMDPHALASRQIGINEIETALKNWNVNLPTGSIIGPQRAFTLQASGQLLTADQYRPVVVAYRNGSPVRLEELGTIIDSVEDDKTASWFYKDKFHSRAIVLAIQRQPGTNTIAVTDGVKNLLPLFQRSCRPRSTWTFSTTVRTPSANRYTDVQFTMLLTLGLVVMVIFLFLRNLSATIIPSLALPFSIIGTFAVMYLLDYSLDNLSMMALILSIGFVVDDAIVMLENIVRHIEMGEAPLLASLKGSAEIGSTIVSMTLSLAAVFIPVLFLGGVLGRLVQGIRRHHHGRHSDFRRGLRHPDPHAVQPLPESRQRGEARLVLPHHRKILRWHAARLRRHAPDGAAPPRVHDAQLRPGARRHLVHVRQDPQRLHPRSGYRPVDRHHRSRAGHLLLPDGGLRAGNRPGRGRRPERRFADGQRRRHYRIQPGRAPTTASSWCTSNAATSANWASRTSSRNCAPSSPPSPA